jgi:predicted phosphatase
MQKLIDQRKPLTDALANCERGAFPGSKEWLAESKALKALRAFDVANPEVHTEIMRKRVAAPAGAEGLEQ